MIEGTKVINAQQRAELFETMPYKEVPMARIFLEELRLFTPEIPDQKVSSLDINSKTKRGFKVQRGMYFGTLALVLSLGEVQELLLENPQLSKDVDLFKRAIVSPGFEKRKINETDIMISDWIIGRVLNHMHYQVPRFTQN